MKVNEIITKQIIEAIESSGELIWESGLKLASNAITGNEYHGINALLLGMSKHSSNIFLTENQCKKLKGKIKASEFRKTEKVVFYKNCTKKDKETDKDSRYFLMRYYQVYNASQCENLPDKYKEQAVPVDQVEAIEKAKKIIADSPCQPDLNHGGKKNPCYSPGTDTITMKPINWHDSMENYYSIYFHELAHATGASNRLDRDISSSVLSKGEDYSREELVAELTAAFLCAHCGIKQTVTNSAAYLKGWLSVLRNDNNAIIYAAAKAQKAMDYIIGVKA